MITARHSRLTVFMVGVLAGISGCERDSPGNDTTFFFVDHVDRAETSGSEANIEPLSRKLWDRFTFGYETRRALTPPLPSRITFELPLPTDPILRFALAASTMGRPTLLAPVEFRLLVDSGNNKELVFTETVRRSQPNRWFTREVDLSLWAGSTVHLSFETRLGTGGVRSARHNILPLWGNPVLASRDRVATKPNLILISVDCLRADHLGAYGYERDTSPRVDEFSREAVLFQTAVSTSSYTLPTHASMLTGLPPGIHWAARVGISTTVPYAPELLAEAGYRVNGVVTAPFLSRSYGFHRGFHTYENRLARADERIDKGLELLREGGGQDQFLFLHLMDVHWPYSPPRQFITRFGERPRDISSVLSQVGQRAPPISQVGLDQIVNLYDAEIAYVDRELGRFFDELKEMKLYDDALIILTADHGEAFYEHGHWEHARPWSNDGPGLYEEIVHIPLIVKWPREFSGVKISRLVSQTDVFPTLLEAAGLERPNAWATSLRHHLVRSSRPPVPRTVIAEFTSSSAEGGAAMQIAFRSQDSKYIATFRSRTIPDLYSSSIEKEELYDLSNDPREEENLLLESDRGPGSYRKALRAYLAEARKRLLQQQGEEISVDESVLEELRTLGYVER